MLLLFLLYGCLHEVSQQKQTKKSELKWELLKFYLLNKQRAYFGNELSAIDQNDPIEFFNWLLRIVTDLVNDLRGQLK